MADKKKVNAQAKGRASKSLRESDKANMKIQQSLQMTRLRSGQDGGKGSKPAGYGNSTKNKTPIQKLQESMYGAYKNPTNALARNRSAKAKDSRPKKK